jgi:hypothetical protein
MTRLGYVTCGLILALLLGSGASAQGTPAPQVPDLPPDLRNRFLAADITNRGGLNKTEAASAGFAVEGTFDTMDTDKDRIITMYEIGGYLAQRSREWIDADRDRDGTVSRSEASQNKTLAGIFTKADRDGDGIVRKEEHEAFSQTTLYQNVDLPYVVPNIINKKF